MASVIRGSDNFDSLLAQFDAAHSFSTNGYQKLSNGLMFQWYDVSIGGDRNSRVNHPVAFPNACLNGVAVKGGGQVGTDSYTGLYSFSKTQVTVANGTNSTQTHRLFLIGY